MKRDKLLLGGFVAAAAIAYVVVTRLPGGAEDGGAVADGSAMVAIEIPELTDSEMVGQRMFEAKCAVCHGPNATGRKGSGPPLVHKIYEPGHHGDEAFQRAVAQGVKAHHWRFGDMAAVSGLTRGDVAAIVSYVRALQRANGIR